MPDIMSLLDQRKGYAMDASVSLKGLLNTIVPISRFNRGEANKIFDEVNTAGVKIVMKNNVPTCVLVTPERYDRMMEIVEDFFLLEEAEQRLAEAEKTGYISSEEVMKSLGISEADLDNTEDVEIE